jgi:Protein of unknown function (DUF3300)
MYAVDGEALEPPQSPIDSRRGNMLAKLELLYMLAIALTVAIPPPAVAQAAPGAPSTASASPQRLSAQQLDTLVASIALYPDDLLAIVLPSSTTPLEVVKAQRFLDKRKSNSSLQPDAAMPAPVKSLLNYPEVVKKMSDDIDWTSALGSAVTAQQKDVIDAIQAFRRKVHSVGNLKTDEKQIVVVEKETIKVVQADPQVIYVPQYQPAQVVVVQSAPVYAYYPTPYPVYYYPYPPGAAFATGVFVGAVTASAFNWNNATLYNTNVQELQQERMNYANNAREDRQAQSSANQSQRQSQASQNQTQRQQQAASTSSANQTQRQDAAASQQAERQQGASQRQDAGASQQAQRQDSASQQRQSTQQTASANQSQRQQSASQAQGGGQSALASQTGGASAGSYSRPQASAGGGASAHSGAFGGMNSGAGASRASSRGSASRGGGRRG